MTKQKLLLVLILIFFLITRLYKITEVPVSLYWDEASIGYNAYSVLLTGKDEWGKAWPLHFRAFGEFKLPVYIYSVAAAEIVFGPTELAVRLPAVFYSLFSVVLVYLLSFQIFKNQKLSLLSAFFMSISPWFFIFSRTGYEASAGLMFYLLGVYLFFSSSNKPYLILISFLSFLISIYSYNSFRIISPLTLVSFYIWEVLLFCFKKTRAETKYKSFVLVSLISFLIFSLVSFPAFRLLTSSTDNTRLAAVGIFNNAKSNEIILNFSQNYLNHFSPVFLFLSGDKNLRSQVKNTGQLYFLDLIFLFLGVIYIFKKAKSLGIGHDLFKTLFPILAILISLIPSAITIESPHALRTLSVVPFLSILLANGFIYISQKINLQKVLWVVVGVYLILFAPYFLNFLGSYKAYSAASWQYGYKQLFTNYSQDFKKYDHVLISDNYAQPYIFALFYMRINPSEYLSSVQYNSPDKWGFSKVASFNNLNFEQISPNKIPMGKSLLFASNTEKLENIPEKGQIYNLDGSVAFFVYELDK